MAEKKKVNIGYMLVITVYYKFLINIDHCSQCSDHLILLYVAMKLTHIRSQIIRKHLYPIFVLIRFFIWIIAKTTYRLKYEGRENIPKDGPAFLLPNHSTYIDWAILAATCKRPIRFVMYYQYYYIPVFKYIFQLAGCIPVAQYKDSPEIKEKAFKLMEEAIENGDLVCVFPEGTLTRDGELVKFRSGYERVLERLNTKVIPIAMTGLWGSYFSRKGGRALLKVPKPSRRKLYVKILEPIPKESATAEHVQELIHSEIDKMNQTF